MRYSFVVSCIKDVRIRDTLNVVCPAQNERVQSRALVNTGEYMLNPQNAKTLKPCNKIFAPLPGSKDFRTFSKKYTWGPVQPSSQHSYYFFFLKRSQITDKPTQLCSSKVCEALLLQGKGSHFQFQLTRSLLICFSLSFLLSFSLSLTLCRWYVLSKLRELPRGVQ